MMICHVLELNGGKILLLVTYGLINKIEVKKDLIPY